MVSISLTGDSGDVSSLDAALEADIRFTLGINAQMSAQRETCDPLFATVGAATTDVARMLGRGIFGAGLPPNVRVHSFESVRID